MRGFFGGDSSSESAVRSMGGFFLGCVCVTRGGAGDGAGGDGARGTDACAGAVGSGGGDG